jgi:hypothetical protein
MTADPPGSALRAALPRRAVRPVGGRRSAGGRQPRAGEPGRHGLFEGHGLPDLHHERARAVREHLHDLGRDVVAEGELVGANGGAEAVRDGQEVVTPMDGQAELQGARRPVAARPSCTADTSGEPPLFTRIPPALPVFRTQPGRRARRRLSHRIRTLPGGSGG